MARASGSIRCTTYTHELTTFGMFQHAFLGEFHIMDTLVILYIGR